MPLNERTWLISGFVTVFLLLVVVPIWASLTEIDGAVIATAQVVPKGNSKTIQHIDGGIVSEILVKDGDFVEKGQPLLRLDDQLLFANLSVIDSQLIEAIMQETRLHAERSGLPPKFPEKWLSLYDRAQLQPIFDEQLYLYQARQNTKQGQIDQLNEQIIQLNALIDGYQGLYAGKQRQLEIINQELKDNRALYQKGNMAKRQVMETEKTQASLQGEISELSANISKTRASISEIKFQILQIDTDRHQETLEGLREIAVQIKDLLGQRVTAQTKLNRLEIRAPVAGEVMELSMHTESGVVQPAKPILKIVPDKHDLLLQARIETQHIDQVEEGQAAFVRFSAFNQRTTAELEAIVTSVSADTVQDDADQQFWYLVDLELLDGQAARLGNNKIIAGMPVEVFIRTQSRNILSYFTKPFTDQLMRAFREE